MNEVATYVRTDNGNIIILKGNQASFRCRQRNKFENGKKCPSLKFVSFKEMESEKKRDSGRVMTINNFDTMSRL